LGSLRTRAKIFKPHFVEVQQNHKKFQITLLERKVLNWKVAPKESALDRLFSASEETITVKEMH
jgi:hypothetical protein